MERLHKMFIISFSSQPETFSDKLIVQTFTKRVLFLPVPFIAFFKASASWLALKFGNGLKVGALNDKTITKFFSFFF